MKLTKLLTLIFLLSLVTVSFQNCDGKFKAISFQNSSSSFTDQDAVDQFKVCRKYPAPLGWSQTCTSNSVFFNSYALPLANKNTITILNKNFAKDDTYVYAGIYPIIGVNINTFEVIEGFLARDDKQLYYSDTPLYGTNPNTFTQIHKDTFYMSDNLIYFAGQILSSKPIPSFKFLGGKYWRDSNSVFYSSGQKLLGLSGNSLTVLGEQHLTDGTKVYYQNMEIMGANPSSFKVLSGRYSTDDTNVYYTSNVIPQATPASYVVLDEYYSKDATNVYYRGGIIPGAQAASFTVLFTGMAKDSSKVYRYSTELLGANPNQPITQLGGVYFSVGNTVYVNSTAMNTVDLASFEVLSINFGKDQNNVYSGTQILPGANPTTAKVMGHTIVDGDNVYCRGALINGIQGSTFSWLTPFFFIDSGSVYDSSCQVMNNLSPANIKVLGKEYLTDGTMIYSTDQPIPNADPNSFVLLQKAFAKDNNQVYFISSVLTDALPDTFEILAGYSNNFGGFSTDGIHYYYNSSPLPTLDVDFTNFTALEYIYAKSVNAVFRSESQLTGADPATFEVLNLWYAKDSNNVYYINGVLPGASPNGFTPLVNFWSHDLTNGFYRQYMVPGGVDTATFKANTLDNTLAEDVNNIYKYNSGDNSFTITPK